MKKSKRMLSFFVAIAMMITFLPVIGIQTLAASDLTVYEAENTPGIADSRQVKADRILCDRDIQTFNFPLFTAGQTIEAGHYRVVVFVNLLNEPTNADNPVLYFDVYGNKGTGMEVMYPSTVSRAAFGELNKFQPVVFEFTTGVVLNDAQLRLRFEKNSSLEIDKFALLKDSYYYQNVEAETLGTQLPDGSIKAGQGILAQKGVTGQRLATWGWGGTIPAGSNKAVIYMKLIEKSGSPTNVFSYFTLSAATATSPKSERFGTEIKESMFPELNKYYAIEIPLNTAEELTVCEPYLWHALGGAGAVANCTYMIDRIEFTRSDFNTAVAPVDNAGGGNNDANTIQAEACAFQTNTRSVTGDGLAVECNPAVHDAGFFVFGSNLTFEPGTYKISAVMKIKGRTVNSGEKFASFDTFYNVDGTPEVANVYAIRDILFSALDTWTPVDFYFKTEATLTNAQIRMQSYDKIDFLVDKFVIEPLVGTSPMIVQAETIDGNLSGHFTSEGIACAVGDPVDWVTFGSRLVLDSGKYNVTVIAKQTQASAIATDGILTFSLSYKKGSTDYSGFAKTIKQSDFAQIGQYQSFVIPVEVPLGERFTESQLMLRFEGKTGIVLDCFEILRTGDAGPAVDPVPQPFFAAEAESLGSNIGANVGNGIVCAKGMGENYAIFGTNIQILPGNWRAVIYMKIYNKTGNNSSIVSLFDIYCNPDGGPRTQIENTKITEGMFPQINTYYPIVISFSTIIPLQSSELRVFYNDIVNLKYDKVMLLKEGDILPDAVQEADIAPRRPDGVPVYDNFTVPLTTENILFSSTLSGKIANDRIEFRKNEHIRGDIRGIKEKVYLTNGEKIARFYIRTPEAVSGTYKFFKLTLMKNLMPVTTIVLTGTDLANYANKSFVVEIPFTADENMPMDFMMSWLGNHDIIIDKIVFKNNDTPDNTAHTFAMTSNGTTSSILLRPQDVENFSAIDTLEVTGRNGVKMILPASNVQEWLKVYTSMDVIMEEPDESRLGNLANMANAYEAKVNKASAFRIRMVFHSADGDVTLDTLPSFIDIILPVNPTVIAGKNMKFIENLIYMMTETGKISMVGGHLSKDGTSITFATSTMGTYYVGLADLTSYIMPSVVLASPNTGDEPIVPYGMLFLLSFLMFLPVAYGKRIKKIIKIYR